MFIRLATIFSFSLFPIFAAATSISIQSPLNGSDLRLERGLVLNYTVNSLDESDAKIIVFRSNNGAWPKVHEVSLSTTARGALRSTATPAIHFCEDVYAIRIMSGARTLAGPVHFQAGVGACSNSDKSKFVNLESNLIDLLNFTPLNQLDRDTCGAFASTTALSAAYRRLKGINQLFSQNYKHHMVKSTGLSGNPVYLYENQSSFWGGNSISDAFKTLVHYPVPPVAYSPYLNQTQLSGRATNLGITNLMWNENPQINRVTQEDIDLLEYDTRHIPLIARQLAVYGIGTYRHHTGGDARDTTRIENYLKAGQEVVIGMTLRWRAAARMAKTMIYDSTGTGAHMMVIVGFDKTDSANPYFLIKNSWADGILRVHYDVVRNQTNSEIGVIDSVRDQTQPSTSRWLGRWEMRHDNWRGELFLRRSVESNLNRTSGYLRLGEYHHQNGKRHCVYGTWGPYTKKLMLKINFDSTIEDKEYTVTYNPSKPSVKVVAKSVCPETASGQYFELNMATNTHNQASGFALWNNIQFTAEIWRE
jgi:hypothetical protein